MHASEPTMRDNSVETLPKNGPFLHSGHTYPLPCLPQPLPFKINVVLWTLKSFLIYFRQHLFWGVRGFMAFKRNEIVDKSTHFKQVCQLLLSLIVAIVHPLLFKPWT